jgi:hypothetical protein
MHDFLTGSWCGSLWSGLKSWLHRFFNNLVHRKEGIPILETDGHCPCSFFTKLIVHETDVWNFFVAQKLWISELFLFFFFFLWRFELPYFHTCPPPSNYHTHPATCFSSAWLDSQSHGHGAFLFHRSLWLRWSVVLHTPTSEQIAPFFCDYGRWAWAMLPLFSRTKSDVRRCEISRFV